MKEVQADEDEVSRVKKPRLNREQSREDEKKDEKKEHKDDNEEEKTIKKKRRYYTNAEKAEWLHFVQDEGRQNLSNNHLAELMEERFGVPFKTARNFLCKPKKFHEAIEMAAKDTRDAKLKHSSQYLKKRRRPRDPEVDEALYTAFKKRREEHKRVNWKWFKIEYKKIYHEVHGVMLERVSGSVSLGF